MTQICLRPARHGAPVCLLMAGIVSAHPALADEPVQQVIEAGAVRVVLEPYSRGMSIFWDGVMVSRGSDMVVTHPDWTPHYYLGPSAEAVRTAQRETIDNGVRLRMTHRGGGRQVDGTDVITVTADGRIERIFEGRFLGDAPEALLQWQMAGIDPVVIIGRPFQAVLADDRVVHGTVPIEPTAADMDAAALAKGMRSIEFDSRIGPIRIDLEATPTTIVCDYRKNRWADPKEPMFWFGEMGIRLNKDQSVRYRIVFHLPPPPIRPTTEPGVRVSVPVVQRSDAQTFELDESPTLIPRPKEVVFGQGRFVVLRTGHRSPSNIVMDIKDDVQPRVSDLAAPAILEWTRSLRDRWMGESAATQSAPSQDGPVIRFELAPSDARLPAEGYELNVAPEGVLVRAGDARGFLHAVQTLKQLTGGTPGGDVVIRAATIRDWPSLAFRGAHLFTGGRGPELHERLIRNIIAGLKMNHVVIEAEYVKWDSHPEIHHPQFGMDKRDVRRILDVCRSLGVEVTPLVQSLGHCQWMFTNNQNLDLCEDPDAQWAYCVTNPKTYDFIYEVYQEAVDLFRPKFFHIGHDEFDDRGRVPHRPESRKYTIDQLLMMDVRRHHEWFSQRGIRLMLWGDMFLAKGEAPDACNADSVEAARTLRAQLPQDVVVMDWHYADRPHQDFVSLDTFRESGHSAIAAVWYHPGNVVNFAKAAHDRKATGLLQTTWAGYSLDPESFEREIHQYQAYVLAAEAAWNADHPPSPDARRWDWHFFDLMGTSVLRPAQLPGWTADLITAYNESLAAADAAGWFGLGLRYDLSAVPSGPVRMKGIAFQLAPEGQRSAVVLRGKLSAGAPYPAAIDIGLNRRARQIAILHTANFAAPRGTKIATYEIAYEDGSKAAADAVYGTNVFAYDDLLGAAQAPVVWSGSAKGGRPVALRVMIWPNPSPDKLIRSITARSADAGPSLILIGLTGLGERAAQTAGPPQ